MTKTKLLNVILPGVLAIFFIGAAITGKNTCTLIKDYVVTIKGTSNLHGWEERVEIVTGDGIVNLNKDGSLDLENINIKMDVHSFKSDMGSVMNNNTYKALKADANPEIIFTLKVPVKSIQPKPNEKTISAKGNLTIAGITRFVDMPVKVFMQDQGKIAFYGFYSLKMTDYGVDPPTALFGTLKTGNEITINFKVNFKITPALTNKNN
ncbi:MAG: YceI family protein [Bacteroidia bacterium]|nr:YceI family protein [Bacteroidia bacterium]